MVYMKFDDWLRNALRESKVSNIQLSKTVKVSHPRISQLLSGDRPSADLARRIANALNRPEDEALVAAEYMSASPDRDALIEEILNLVANLDESDKSEVADFVRMKLQRKKQASAQRATTKR
jgi:transcriptional regulator with XRE-family HTH domain